MPQSCSSEPPQSGRGREANLQPSALLNQIKFMTEKSLDGGAVDGRLALDCHKAPPRTKVDFESAALVASARPGFSWDVSGLPKAFRPPPSTLWLLRWGAPPPKEVSQVRKRLASARVHAAPPPHPHGTRGPASGRLISLPRCHLRAPSCKTYLKGVYGINLRRLSVLLNCANQYLDVGDKGHG